MPEAGCARGRFDSSWQKDLADIATACTAIETSSRVSQQSDLFPFLKESETRIYNNLLQSLWSSSLLYAKENPLLRLSALFLHFRQLRPNCAADIIMATKAANRRVCHSLALRRPSVLTIFQLTREYQNIQQNPPPYIIAHPSESNILEWHYILTGPPKTPYEGGQFAGSLIFPPDYPFAPPAIRMATPSGRFQPSTRLCLSISDFHPKSFNPAWEVSTILIGLLSFMTSDEMTTGSMRGTENERKWYAARSKWWNSTGGGACAKPLPTGHLVPKGVGSLKGEGGAAKFRAEWPELDEENWRWMKENRVDAVTGRILTDPEGTPIQCSAEAAALRRRLGGSSGGVGAVVQGSQAARDASQSWLRRNKVWLAAGIIIIWALLGRVLGDGGSSA